MLAHQNPNANSSASALITPYLSLSSSSSSNLFCYSVITCLNTISHGDGHILVHTGPTLKPIVILPPPPQQFQILDSNSCISEPDIDGIALGPLGIWLLVDCHF
ncbi:hypothetical protein TorRG33x02_062620 [Trema orientale]|uniref:Uncharacterized protein n=1 Tax=Trema orientale TaxID=63057 RepID=A0A2P5FJI8_TREOI|nr:hypothetical protein TorRG33x02_062620 [Trema orientale]